MLFWRASGIMLLGMALFKLGVLSGTRSKSVYRILLALALAVALPLTALGFHANVASD